MPRIEHRLEDAQHDILLLAFMVERSTRAQSIGVSVSETKPEITIAMAMVTANSRNTRPTMPPISRTGMKTAISENVIDTMVKPISREP